MKSLSNLRGSVYKFVQVFSLAVLVLNMSLSGVFFVFAPSALAETVLPYIGTNKQAESSTCEQAEITLTITGAGNPIEERKPVDVVFVIDRSSSMEGSYLTDVKNAVKDFIDEMDFTSAEPDRVGVVSYAGYASNPAAIDYALGSNGTDAKNAVDGIAADGGTCIECGLKSAYSMLNSTTREQFVILLSDGVANVKSPGTYNGSNVCNFYDSNQDLINCPIVSSNCTDNAVTQGMNIKNDFGAKIYSIGYRLGDIDVPAGTCDNSGQTTVLAEQTLKDISSNPVDYYYSGDPTNINSVFDDISKEINNVAGYDAKIVEVLPAEITYVSMVSGMDPTTVNGQIITWDFGNISIGDVKEVTFAVATGNSGYSGLADVYPDTRVEYKDYEDTLQKMPFPEINISIESCNPVTTGSISGCKWLDENHDGIWQGTSTPNPEFTMLSDWEIVLDDGENTQSQLTDDGCYMFSGLAAGTYTLTEIISPARASEGWIQTYPGAGAEYKHVVEITSGENLESIDFGNYLPECGNFYIDEGEDCDDGNIEDGDGCSNTCTIEENNSPVCGNEIVEEGEDCDDGPSGSSICTSECTTIGGGPDPYCGDNIRNGEEECDGSDGVDSGYYCTNECALEQESSGGGGSESYCGDNIREGGEECDGTDVEDGYQCRSDCTKYQPNNTLFPTNRTGSNPAPTPIVLGEEGEPVLSLTKTVDAEYANPGDKNIRYRIRVANNGNLTAYNVVISDNIPDVFSFVDQDGLTKTWEATDIEPGDTKEVSYLININEDAEADIYTNLAEVNADNNDPLSVSVELEVRAVKVLAETGMNYIELFILFGALAAILGGAQAIKRKVKTI